MKNLLLAAAIFMASAVSAAAQQQGCGPREIVVELLTDGFEETRQSLAVGSNNTLVEVWANTEGETPTGSWSITVTHPSGDTCLVAYGRGYESTVEPLIEGDPT